MTATAALSPSTAALERLRDAVIARRHTDDRLTAAARANLPTLPLDSPGADALAVEDRHEDLPEVVCRVRSSLREAFLAQGVSSRRAKEASRRIVGAAFLREVIGLDTATQVASALGCSPDSLERDQELLARLGGSAALERAE